MTVLALGDQLATEAGPIADRPDDRVLLLESHGFARRLPYHPHKLTLVFAAMRAFRDRLRDRGRTVDYRQADSFDEALAAHLADHPGDELVAMRPASHGAGDRLRAIVERHGGGLELVENCKFLVSPAEFDAFAGEQLPKLEQFYRHVRRETGYLMADGEPVGGEWNYDDQNRETPPDDYDPGAPATAGEPPTVAPDERTRRVAEWVAETFDGGYEEPPYGGDWADPGEFRWPVTRADARSVLERFCEDHLAAFGPYQDAMVDGEWALHHSLLSAPLNLGLLRPGEVLDEVVEAAKTDPDVPTNSVEGFVRQVLGWREFLRHAYRRRMPAMAAANQLDADRPLPDCYWTGDTDMHCLATCVEGVRERGYSHHIQRLMVLANFATTYGVDPAELNRWFHAGYVDAFHWVTTPNVVGMGTFGTEAVSTKPYVASANYVDEMSDYCEECRFDSGETVGEDACPFNALYWDFLAEHEERLRSTGRMGLVYHHLDEKRGEQLEQIRERARTVRERVADGDL